MTHACLHSRLNRTHGARERAPAWVSCGGITPRAARLARIVLTVAVLVPCPARSAVVASDDFDYYTSGAAVAGQGGAVHGWWAGNWVAAAATPLDATVTNEAITFAPVGGQMVGGDAALGIAGSGTGLVVSRRLYSPQTGTFYAGMLVKWYGGALNTSDSLALFLSDSETNVTHGFNFGLYGIWSQYGTSVRTGTGTPQAGAYQALPSQFGTYYMVVKVEKTGGGNYNRITGWINPASNSATANPAGDIQLSADAGISNVAVVIFRGAGFDFGEPNGPEDVRVDALTLGTTFADLMKPAGDPPPDPGAPVEFVRVETRANGSGTVVAATNLTGGKAITNFAIGRSWAGAFVTNAPATWRLTNVTGSVWAGDLQPSSDGKSAVFTATGAGSAKILAAGTASTPVPSGTITVTNPPNPRPFIWVRSSERAGILAKIASNAWATSLFSALADRVAADVDSHAADRDAWLRQLPVLWSNSPAEFKTIPTYSESSVRGPTESKFNDALDCAVLYYLTGDEAYARCAADVLHNAVRTLLPVAPSTSVGNGGWIFESDLLKEARVVGTQLPVVYDLLYYYLKSHPVYDVQTAGLMNFNFTNAQSVFRTYYQLCRDHGQGDDNWSALMATCMLNNLLAFDDVTERTNSLHVYLYQGTSRQSSLDHDYHRDYDNPGDIWHESLQYSSAVGSIRTFHMVLLERYDPTLNLFGVYSNVPTSLPRISQLRYPNPGMQISFGDGSRDAGGQPYFSYELVYQHARARGRTNLTALFGGLINGGISAGEYSRSSLNGYSSLGSHNEPLELLWNAPAVTEPGVALSYPRTDALPWAGISLQRNPSTVNNSTYGLMCFVGGAAHVHSHASGMNLELFGLGQVLGAKAGTDAYGSALHENYYRLFSAANTIVVNAGSRGSGGWADLAINTVQSVAMEPQPFAAAVSSNHSFTCSSFSDTMGTLAEATQQRTLAIIRTSPTNGFYVDFFRSRSTVSNRVAKTLNGNVTNQFHDYLYHNVGSTNVSITVGGTNLALLSQSARFQNDIGDTYDQPGWRYFTNTVVSYPQGRQTRVQFNAKPSATTLYMDMILPAVTNREYARVSSPPISDYSTGTAPSPAVAIRQIGEAWNKPFAVVYEPHFSADGATVTNVTALWRSNLVVGLKIESMVDGRDRVHYVLSNPNATDVYQDGLLGLSFTGRFAIVADHGGGMADLYVGSGSYLAYRGHSVRVAGGTNSQAEVRFTPGKTPSITANSAVAVAAAAAPTFAQIDWLGDGAAAVSATGGAGVLYTLWSSTNLAGGPYSVLTRGSVTNSPFVIRDDGAIEAPARFYRLSLP